MLACESCVLNKKTVILKLISLDLVCLKVKVRVTSVKCEYNYLYSF